MNDLVTQHFGSVVSAKAYAAALARTAEKNVGSDGLPILKLGKDDGLWYFGEDNTQVSDKDVWVVDAANMQHGFIAFKLGENGIVEYEDDNGDIQLAEFLVPVTQDENDLWDRLPELDPETYRKDKKRVTETPEFKYQQSFKLRCIEGDNEGEVVVYKPTAPSALSEVSKMQKEIAKRLMDEGDNSGFMPVISLSCGGFKSKNYGHIRTPKFEYVDWVLPGEFDFDADIPEEETEEEEKPKKSTRKKAPAKTEAKKPATKNTRKKKSEPESDEDEDYEDDDVIDLEEDEYEEIDEDEYEEEEEAPEPPKKAPAGRGTRQKRTAAKSNPVPEEKAAPRGRKKR